MRGVADAVVIRVVALWAGKGAGTVVEEHARDASSAVIDGGSKAEGTAAVTSLASAAR